MADDDLKAHFDELRSQLKDSKLDSEDQNMIGHLMSEIVKVASEEEEAEQEPHHYLEKLEEQAAKLESAHPLIASTLRQVAHLLGNMGI